MGDFLFTLVAFIVALGILIAVHEFGHYWVAVKSGVKVLRFSIGFGKPIWKKVSGVDKTEYVVAAIPLGGFVKMLDEREGDVAENELHRAFNRQALHKRAAIVFAGPLFNFIFAVFAYWIIYMLGVPGIKPVVHEVEENSVAQRAGLEAGDQILSVSGHETATWSVARIKILTESLDNDEIPLIVLGTSGATRQITMPVANIAAEANDGRVLDELGIKTPRPQLPAVIGELIDGGRALDSGLKQGDRILSADGQAIKDWQHWVEYVQAKPETRISVEVDRDGSEIFINLVPARVKTKEGKEIGRIGAAPFVSQTIPEELRAEVKYGPLESALISTKKTWDMSIFILRMIGKMFLGDVSLDNLSGPITIAKYAGYTASVGIVTFLSFLAVVSISLGVLNLLPIPLLDGGHLMFYAIELIKGSPVTEAVEMMFQRVGLVMLMLLMSIAIYNDITRLFN